MGMRAARLFCHCSAVTYKRIAPAHQQRVLKLSAPALPDRAISLNAVVSRKRKKPGAGTYLMMMRVGVDECRSTTNKLLASWNVLFFSIIIYSMITLFKKI